MFPSQRREAALQASSQAVSPTRGSIEEQPSSQAGAGGPADAAPAVAHSRVSKLRDGMLLGVLVVVVVLGWLVGTGRWSGAAWSTPLQYLDPYYSDVITTLTGMKAAHDGSAVMFWKLIPGLGAPFEGNWNDFPSNEELVTLLLGILAKVFGMFVGLNAALLVTHVLAAVIFFLVARALDCARPWAFVGALAYGLAPYIFAQTPHHLGVASVWHLPLCVLVWTWLSDERGLALGTRRFWAALAIGALVGAMNVYYIAVFCQLTLGMALPAAVRARSWAPLRVPVAVVAIVVCSFALMHVDSWSYAAVHGKNPAAFVREYKWIEIYSLKLVDLLMPPPTHHVQVLADFGARHRASSVLQNEGAYFGVVGVAALALLASPYVVEMLFRRRAPLPVEGWQVLWIWLYFSTGGLNTVVGAFGFTLLRAGGRTSAVILAIVLLYAARRLTALERAQVRGGDASVARTSLLGGIVLAAVIVLDQVPSAPAPEDIADVAAQVDADRAFVAQMEARLPAGALVFQLPVMEFPEGPVPGVGPYEHLRPFLFSRQLRFSFGSVRGRAQDAWQAELGRLPLEDRVAQLRARGFAAVVVNRKGFPDGGKAVIDALRSVGPGSAPFENAIGDLVCVPLL